MSTTSHQIEGVFYYLKALGLGLMLGALYWVGESLLHFFVLQASSTWNAIFPSSPNEIWMRLFVVTLFLVVTVVLAYVMHTKFELSEMLKLSYLALDQIREGTLITNHENKIIYINKRYTEISGYQLSEVYGKNPNVLSSGKQSPEFYQQLWNDLKHQGYWEGEIWNRRKSGDLFPEWISISLLKDAASGKNFYVAIFTDISSRKYTEEKMAHYAFYDPLTGLPNRLFFIEQLSQAIQNAKRINKLLAVLFIDIDHFKAVNDQYGHLIGDQFLYAVGQFLKSILRESDIVSRFGGDEFVILLTNVPSKEAAVHTSLKILQKSRSLTVNIVDQPLSVSLSIGGALYPQDSLSVETLLQHADSAMYHVKKTTRQNVCFYEEDLDGKK